MQRRTFLLGAGTAAALAACGSSGTTSTTTAPASTTSTVDPALSTPVTLPADGLPPFPEPGQTGLGARFPDGFRTPNTAFVAGTETRAPYVAIDANGQPLTGDAPDTITVAVQFEGEVIHTERITVRGKGEFTPYYPVTFTPAETGDYAMTSDFSDVPAWFRVATATEVLVPQIGAALPGFDTPTFTDGAGVDPICTFDPEPCPFHEVTLTNALGSGKTAFLIATPAYCQTDTCGPSVDYFVELAADFPDITFVHAEVYAADINEAGPVLAPVVSAYQMPWEPAMWVTDANGTIVSALHFAMARDDMRAALGRA
ncbi:MAG: hypothetical protein HKN26_04320 [Acidimicrobiales bacterium]|nr:hypothetical protein [Acidimicrobiales bacterium]